MSSIFEETGGLLPSELMPVYKNHQALPISGSNESLKELLDNYAYPNPYECSVYSGTAPSDGVKYYIPDLGLAEGVLWHIKYFPGDAAGGAIMVAYPTNEGYGIMTRVGSTTSWGDWIEKGGSAQTTMAIITDQEMLQNHQYLYGYEGDILTTTADAIGLGTHDTAWHITYVPYNDTGYGVQIAIPRSSYLKLPIMFRDSTTSGFNAWQSIYSRLTSEDVVSALGYTPASAVSSGQPTEAQIGDIWISDT